jgi:hypothetical protein
MPTVVVYEKGAEAKDCLADLLLHKPTNAELLEKIRIFIQRQHWSGREKNKSPAREIVVQIEEDVA